MRKSWDKYFLDIAQQVAERSTCERLSVGAVIVRHNRIVSTGYNGSIHGQAHCDSQGHLYKNGRCIRTVHAEANAILHANRDDLMGATIYITHYPCENCAKLIAQSGIATVVYSEHYKNIYSKEFLNGIEVLWVGGN